MRPDLNDLEWIILTGKPAADIGRLTLHNEAFDFWLTFWQGVFRGNGVSVDVRSDDMCRQDVISILKYHDRIVGLQCHSVYQINSTAHASHSYFQKLFNRDFLHAIAERDIARAFSMEYLSVDREWRSDQVGISLGSVLIGLGLKLAQEARVDGVVAAARADLPVAKLAYEQGAEPIVKQEMRFNTPVDLILFPAGNYRLPQCITTSAVIESLWKQRHDLRTETPSFDKMVVAA